MKCTMCGREAAWRGSNQKYCLLCAEKAQKIKQKLWYETHKKNEQKYCRQCGKPIEHNHRFCDECNAEHKRTYQREYRRAYRARLKVKEALS